MTDVGGAGGFATYADTISVGTLITTIITFGGLAWWLSRQFNDMRREIYQRIEKVVDTVFNRIDKHEQQDNLQFDSLKRDVWLIRLRNAAKDGNGHLTLAEKEERVYTAQ